MPHKLSFFDCAESSVIVSFGPQYNKEISLEILGLAQKLESLGLSGFKESIPALCTLTVFYDPAALPRERLVSEITALHGAGGMARAQSKTFEIPVVYGGSSGPDLDSAADQAGLTPGELIERHTAPTYDVYMLGFLPGFAYLGDLDPTLHLPRRSTPRARVPAGSVAIASSMTAIYPLESPGGWHLIGSTPALLWDMSRQREPLLKPGDQVRFKPISANEAASLRAGYEHGAQILPLETA